MSFQAVLAAQLTGRSGRSEGVLTVYSRILQCITTIEGFIKDSFPEGVAPKSQSTHRKERFLSHFATPKDGLGIKLL